MVRKRLMAVLLLPLLLPLLACPKFVASSVDTLAAAQGFIAQAQLNHQTECKADPTKNFPCQMINQAVDAQNTAVDALEAYCQLPVRPDPIALKAQGGTTCNENPSAKQVLVSALANLGTVLANYKAQSGGKP